MAINFPNSPAVNDTFTVGGINFTFTGVKWESGAVVEISSDTTPTLGGHLDGGAKNINNVGVITATGFSGPLTGNVTGNATGLTGDPSIQVTNATVLGNLDVQGTTTTIDTAVTAVDSLAVDGSITALGNCGIGTNNPVRKLDVDGTSRFTDYIYGNSTTNKIYVNDDLALSATKKLYFDTGSNTYIHEASADTLAVVTGGTEKLRVDSSGRLLLGTTTEGEPNADNLTLADSGSCGITIRSGSSNFGTIYFSDATSGNGEYDGYIDYNHSNSTLRFGTSATTRLTIDSTGNLTSTGTVSDSIGPLRRLGITGMTGNYTLVASDAGKQVRSDGAHVLTLPNSVFETGDMITVTAHSSGAVTINQGSGMTLYNAADGSSGNVTLAARTVCTIFYAEGGSSSKAYIAGGGIS